MFNNETIEPTSSVEKHTIKPINIDQFSSTIFHAGKKIEMNL